MKKVTISLVTLLCIITTVTAQNKPDSLTREIRSYVARNFSEARTFNLYWQTGPNHDYTFKNNGTDMEKGKMRDIHAIQFSGTVPVVSGNKFSLYANWQTNFYKFETINDINNGVSSIFFDDEGSYSYHRGTISGTYKTNILGKPLIINASLSGDGWNEDFEKVFGSLSVIAVLRRTQNSSFSVGLHGTTLFNYLPIVPIISYEYRFNPNLSAEILLPNRAYMRYQFANNHRISVGGSLESSGIYLKPSMTELPKTCYYQNTTVKAELVYEYIINKHFYLIARGGGLGTFNSGLYGTDRKGIDGDPFIEYTQPLIPFFNLGFSYNLFK